MIPEGRTDMLQFRAEPIPDVGIGLVGLGVRGTEAAARLPQVPGCHLAAVCDANPRLAELARSSIGVKVYTGDDGYKAICEDPDVDLIYVCTDWYHHVPIALCAMENGKHAAIEVPSAHTLQECWDLIDTSERTRRHCTILENCCYDSFELTALEMVRRGVFGQLIHAEGSYHHNLEERWGRTTMRWRLKLNRDCRGDLYPTHGIGPVCQALGIHRGDRLKTLVSMDTAPFNGPRYLKANMGEECADFKNGDQTMTMIRTEMGRTILLQHDVMTPRPYDRGYKLVGTEGYAAKYPVFQVCLGNSDPERVYAGDELNSLLSDYRSPILTPEIEEMASRVGGHDGMDFLMDYRLIYCLNHGLPLDMDVYDLAEWCCISELSRMSLEAGSTPVDVPDFTRGAWQRLHGFSYAL